MYRVTERGPWETEGLSEQKDRAGRRRPLVITVEARCVVYRAKGTRLSFRIPHERVYQLAVQAHVEANRNTKRRPSVRRGILKGAR